MTRRTPGSVGGLGLALALAILPCSADPGSAQAASECGPRDAPELESFVDSVLARQLEERHIPGAVVVVIKDGAVLLSKGYGYADLASLRPVEPERTLFRIASISKVFTAAAVMQLAERGRLSLSEDVNRYLQRFQLEPAFPEPVTLAHLLTHSAGFDERGIARRSPTRVAESLADYLARRMPPRVLPPGRYVSYSNHGMALAGHIVEIASGVPFERYMEEAVFAPIAMKRSSFAVPAAWTDDLATGYEHREGRDEPRSYDFIRTVPASMMVTTGDDMARFLIAFLSGPGADAAPWLSQETRREMEGRHFSHHPLQPGVAYGLWERYQNGQRAVWHDGDTRGFASLLYLLPEHKMGLFVAFNSRGGNRARRELLAQLLNRYCPEPPTLPPVPVTANAARFAGSYVSNRYGHRSLEKVAILLEQFEVRANGQALILDGRRYQAIGPMLFQAEDGRMSFLAFEEDRHGRITHLFTGDSIARANERLPWRAALRFVVAGLSGATLIFLSTLAWLAIAWRRKGRAPSNPPGARIARAVALTVSLLNLIFLVGFLAVLSLMAEQLENEVSPVLVALLVIPLVSAPLAVTLVGFAMRSWQMSWWSVAARVHYSVVAAASVTYVLLLNEWNLLGFRF